MPGTRCLLFQQRASKTLDGLAVSCGSRFGSPSAFAFSILLTQAAGEEMTEEMDWPEVPCALLVCDRGRGKRGKSAEDGRFRFRVDGPAQTKARPACVTGEG